MSSIKIHLCHTIEGLKTNLRELLPFIPVAPMYGEARESRDESTLYADDLLGIRICKNSGTELCCSDYGDGYADVEKDIFKAFAEGN
ncbi:hypothetical protein HNR31_003125 [Anoxybacillus caldiproteolyticus]|uniref:Uncharacterized protein n=1 Tax=Thermaerobacillus caldiproteolyticus TaxID=247480 RepID=A0A7V9Z9C0_9BACL|nr:hypothetical protein [Anoxybacillus caldiproteolyticus]MBA2876330.1 hypothetical protein [Anoxybacillus caldiproteolyticus]